MTADGLGGGGGEMGEGVSDAICISQKGFILFCAHKEVHYIRYDVYCYTLLKCLDPND